MNNEQKLLFEAYCAGYESGHNDTVEGNYSPPEEYPEEWGEKEAELVEWWANPYRYELGELKSQVKECIGGSCDCFADFFQEPPEDK